MNILNYVKFVLGVGFTIFVFGFVLPYMISAKSTELVLGGVLLLIIYFGAIAAIVTRWKS